MLCGVFTLYSTVMYVFHLLVLLVCERGRSRQKKNMLLLLCLYARCRCTCTAGKKCAVLHTHTRTRTCSSSVSYCTSSVVLEHAKMKASHRCACRVYWKNGTTWVYVFILCSIIATLPGQSASWFANGAVQTVNYPEILSNLQIVPAHFITAWNLVMLKDGNPKLWP